nr:isoleucine--tRNA ligase [Neorickettsia sp. 179522]
MQALLVKMSNSSYPEISQDLSFAKIEEQILQFWEKNRVFAHSVSSKTDNGEFVSYDGPPFANGLPHYGHLLTGFIKDTVARYQTMLGKKVERRFGWDCHGLPAEMYTEKILKISGKEAIKNFGIDKFNAECKKSVLLFSSEWEYYVTRQGRWVDFHNDYKTMDLSFMESVIWAFRELYKKGLIYESVKVVPYSWACQTPLSNFETRLDNAYREKKSKSVTVAFELEGDLFGDGKTSYLLAWTTTPWTLPSNMMLGISKHVVYTRVEKDGKYYISSKASNKEVAGIIVPNELLVGKRYKPLFEFFAHEKENGAFVVQYADFVTDEDGTGIVHIAPGFGEEDFELAKQHGITVVCPVDDGGRFTSEVAQFAGRHVFETNEDIILILKEKKQLIKIEEYIHSYPHCWRTDTPLIYKVVPSWYLCVSKIKERMLELNEGINWIPSHLKEGLVGKWLENAKDWAISRNRFWGTPVPIWKSTDPSYPRVDVYGSITELEKDFGVKITDLHRPFIDTLTRKNPDDPTGKSSMVRVESVLDCWFESGSMPFAQVHYPFENKEWFEKNFPSDFITEYVAQTRGWFYTLMVLSVALFDSVPFKNCLAHGVILDKDGKKLSKRLNNYKDPKELFDEYGADALRFLMLSSSVMNGGTLLIDKGGEIIKDVVRLLLKPLYSAYNFFATYANYHSICTLHGMGESTNLLDKYIFSEYIVFSRKMRNALDGYHIQSACKNVLSFIDTLNNWYIRRSRERFVAGERQAFEVLYFVLSEVLKIIAPLLPMTAEKIWMALHNDKSTSIHLERYPEAKTLPEDEEIIQTMQLAREICNTALSIRNKNTVRIRQPLRHLEVIGRVSPTFMENTELLSILKDEANVKCITFKESDPQVRQSLKLNFPVLGRRYPQEVKHMINELKSGNWKSLPSGEVYLGNRLLKNDEYETSVVSEENDTGQIGSFCLAVRLNLKLDEELISEGRFRDIVRMIQQARKSAGLTIKEKVIIKIYAPAEYLITIGQFKSAITSSTYASQIIADRSNDFSNCSFVEDVSQEIKIGIMRENSTCGHSGN